MTRVVLVDDEPGQVWYLESAIGRLAPFPVEVVGFTRPAALEAYEHLDEVAVAFVDLSFAVHDRSPLGPELATGVDAIDLLVRTSPGCRPVVVTRYDGEALMAEMVVAIRHTWPSVPFLHKGDPQLPERLADVVMGRPVGDDPIFFEVKDLAPLAPHVIARALARSAYRKRGEQILLALAEWPERPSAGEVAASIGYSTQYVKSVLQSCGQELRSEGLLGPADPLGIERLWPWCRARRPILRRLFDHS